VVWRRFRATLAATGAILAGLAVYLVVDGERARSAYATVRACQPAQSAKCNFLWNNFRDHYGQSSLVVVVLVLLPGLIGAFAGAPLLGRELETGTFRFTWTQGAGRMRWAIALVSAGAVGCALVVGGFGLLISWHNQPLVDSGLIPRLRPSTFPITGVAAAGWATVGYALGVLAGVIWRRVVPALVTAFAAWFGLAMVTATQFRLHYLVPLQTTDGGQLSGKALTVAQWWTKNGHRASSAELNSVLQSVGLQQISGSGKVTAVPNQATDVDPVEYLTHHGFSQITSYQPDSRFWGFQWIEFGWLVGLSLILMTVALWLVRRKPS
jgi:hypothetical protein